MLTNKADLLEYLEIIGAAKPLTEPAAPFIAIPTTAGTGSEVTRNAVLASPEHRLKVSLRSPSMLPKVALVDPELTYDLPPAITAFTGLDALTQLIEPFVCSRANPFTDALCSEAIPRVSRSLRMATEKGTDKKSREDMAVASLFGGLALSNAGLGAVHGFAGPIGGMFPAPHGAVCAALLPHVMQTNWRAMQQRLPQNGALERYQQLARLLTNRPTATAEQGIEFVRTLTNDLQIPPLRTYGLTKSHTELLVQKAVKANSMKANPVQLTDVELAETLEKAL
jgi:alcohol dehydrogenase class IV